jgi:hypothetical protein
MVGGAAYYAGRKVAQGDQRESEQQMRIEALEAQQRASYAPTPQYAAPPPASGPSTVEQLSQLKQLLDAGVLNQAEFEVEKAKVLRG